MRMLSWRVHEISARTTDGPVPDGKDDMRAQGADATRRNSDPVQHRPIRRRSFLRTVTGIALAQAGNDEGGILPGEEKARREEHEAAHAPGGDGPTRRGARTDRGADVGARRRETDEARNGEGPTARSDRRHSVGRDRPHPRRRAQPARLPVTARAQAAGELGCADAREEPTGTRGASHGNARRTTVRRTRARPAARADNVVPDRAGPPATSPARTAPQGRRRRNAGTTRLRDGERQSPGVHELPPVALTTRFLALSEQYEAERLAVHIVAGRRINGSPLGPQHATMRHGTRLHASWARAPRAGASAQWACQLACWH